MQARDLFAYLSFAAACGQHTDTSVSDVGSATAVTTGDATGSSGEPATTMQTGQTSDLTGGLTGGQTGGLSEASTSGVSDSASTGPGTGEPGTSSTDPTHATGGLTTGDLTTGGPQTTTGDDTGGTTGAIDDCDELKAAFASETKQITSCTDAGECGQELKGTSCGCTHDLVARTDADTTHFFELLGMAEDLRCELILAGTCDCPAADGFTCTEGFCAWNYL